MKRALVLAGLVLFVGCSSPTDATNANYIAALNAYYVEHPDCLLDSSVRFPFETGDATQTKQMDALAAAEMLEIHRAPIIKMTRYTITDAGTRFGPHFCYGHRQITAILSTTPLTVVNGFSQTTITYKYKIEDMPMWAKDAKVVAVFPALAHESTGDATGKLALARTKVNWSVPD